MAFFGSPVIQSDTPDAAAENTNPKYGVAGGGRAVRKKRFVLIKSGRAQIHGPLSGSTIRLTVCRGKLRNAFSQISDVKTLPVGELSLNWAQSASTRPLPKDSETIRQTPRFA